MKLKKIKTFTGKIVLKSGLHIGSGDSEMRIGGTDNPVIKHPHTLEPYIPGSSLKGKVRSLLELRSGLIGRRNNGDGGPLGLKDLKNLTGDEKEECLKILKLFGISGADTDEAGEIGPSRVSFADCSLNDDWKKTAIEQNHAFTEVKSENSIDRIKGTALNPRFSERVPAETQFAFTVTMKELEGDKGLENCLLRVSSFFKWMLSAGPAAGGMGGFCLSLTMPMSRKHLIP